MKKTPVEKFLELKKIPFRLLPHSKTAFTAEEAARERRVPLDELVKCVLFTDGKQFVLACVPGNERVDRHKLRKAAGTGKLELATEKQIKSVLKAELGAVSPVAPLISKAKVKIVFDDSMSKKKKVNMSSGSTGAGVELSIKTLASLVKPVEADIVQETG